MQMRCNFCQNMYALSRMDMLIGLQHMKDNNLQHYDAHCPKCRRATRVERTRLERANPDWEKTLAAMLKEQAKAEKEAKKAAVAEKPAEAKPVAKKSEKPAAAKPAVKKPAETKTPAKPAEPKPAAKAPAKPVASKPAATKPVAKKPATPKAR